MNFPSLKEITDKAQNAFKRFPVTLGWAISGSFYFLVLLGRGEKHFEAQLPLLLTFILGTSWLIAARFFMERFERPNKWIWVQAVVLLLLTGYYWQLPDRDGLDDNVVQWTRFCLYFIAGHLFVLFAPFIGKWNNAAYWNYLKSVGFAIFRSGFFSGVLYLGLVLALAAINALFEANVPGERYGQLFIFCLGIVNTWIYLSDFPKNVLEHTSIAFNKALEVFVKYILIPLVLLYIVILYAYTFKIVFEWQLPQGWVSYLVTALALLGFVVQVIINPVQKTLKSWTINRFFPWFYYLLLPLILLLFVAIIRRIGDYGITENRYFVVAIALWILAMALYLMFSKKKRLKVLPISLFLLALLTSFGFWGAFTVSLNSQEKQFAKVFKTVKTNNNLATAEEFQQLQSILSYLDDRESLSKLDDITGIAMQEAFKDTLNDKFGSYGWLDTAQVMDSLGVKMSAEEAEKNNLYTDYYSYSNDLYSNKSFDISTFDHLSTVSFYGDNSVSMDIGAFHIRYDAVSTSLHLGSIEGDDHNEKDHLAHPEAEDGLNTINHNVLEIPLKKKLMDLTRFGSDLNKAGEENLTVNLENDTLKLRLVFRTLNFFMVNDSVEINNAQLFLFLKQK